MFVVAARDSTPGTTAMFQNSRRGFYLLLPMLAILALFVASTGINPPPRLVGSWKKDESTDVAPADEDGEKYVASFGIYGQFSNGQYAFPFLAYLAKTLNRTLVLPHWASGKEFSSMNLSSMSSFYSRAHLEKCGIRTIEFGELEKRMPSKTVDALYHVQINTPFDMDFAVGNARGWKLLGRPSDNPPRPGTDKGYIDMEFKFPDNRKRFIELLGSHLKSKKLIALGTTFLPRPPEIKWDSSPCPLYPREMYIKIARRFIQTFLGGGGNSKWMSVHVRRGDMSERNNTPRIEQVVQDIGNFYRRWNVSAVFVATDARGDELAALVQGVPNVRFLRPAGTSVVTNAADLTENLASEEATTVVKQSNGTLDPFHPFPLPYFPPRVQSPAYAFVEKIILSHADYFLGDPRSSFSQSAAAMRDLWTGPWKRGNGTVALYRLKGA